MTTRLRAAVWLRWVIARASHGAVLLAFLAPAIASAGLPAQSWNGYRWGRTGLLTVTVGNNAAPIWGSYVATAVREWNVAKNLDFAVTAGQSSSPVTCAAVYGTIQLCSGNYGRTGWVGYTNVATSGGYLVQATIRLNDYYFSQPRYDTNAWRAETICQELGNALGLQDADHATGNVNTGSCMDYTRDPSGAAGTNGTLANTAPGASDLAHLNAIYALPGGTQLGRAGTIVSANAAVPEPSSWLLMATGFGIVGSTFRQRTSARIATSAGSEAESGHREA